MRGAWLTPILAFVACAPAHPDFSSTTAIETSQPPIADDADLFDANVVVDLAAPSIDVRATCSGILLSRTRVLTASHCVLGLPTISVGPSPAVGVGSVAFGTTTGDTLVSLAPPLSPNSELGHSTDPEVWDDVGRDLAILSLDEKALSDDLVRVGAFTSRPLVDVSQWGSLFGTHIVRPSLVPPPSHATIALSTWGFRSDRELYTFEALLALHDDAFTLSRTGASPGDSGAPLFAFRSDGSRDPFGMVSGGNAYGDANFVNLTSPRNSQWIASQMTDHSHDGERQIYWRAQHPPPPGQTTWWIGEDDYSGPCAPTFDPDCDHWLDGSDNCPTVFNHDQTDSDDDGVGDACPQ